MTAPTDTPITDEACKENGQPTKFVFADDMRKLERKLSAALAEVKRLNEWADGMTDAALKERQTGEMYQRELRAEIERLRQHQDELARRVVAIFREEMCDSLIGDAPPPTVSKIIARVRAEMEKEKGNG